MTRRVEAEEGLLKLEKAFWRLKEALAQAKDELDRDGVIQRFELTVELCWKALKRILAYKGVECHFPRDCIKQAFRYGLIENDDLLLDMLSDRNLCAHLYDEKLAEEVYGRIKEIYVRELERLVLSLKEKL
ncbi:HI0074 family nucleotidyltransferase substrate-binding subunit [Thermosulfurimonas sp.]|uniref:HI0074 family nucleotidyltransferase substrate-binding subunit n=1 Tax=Thermosulfurimonas sp. TaxID=2080236 RepID=UPI0025CB8143|nr:HI0074 family nucleotidyltransferase substrate-binding subunit [Thermosulfurimonas sp.]